MGTRWYWIRKFNLNTCQNSGNAYYLMLVLHVSVKFKLLTNGYLKNRHRPWKSTRVTAHILLLTKQSRGTYTKSQDMKRFIIRFIIVIISFIWTNSLRSTALHFYYVSSDHLITIRNKILKVTQRHKIRKGS